MVARPTLDQLRVLIAVSVCGSFRRAAARLHRVQSAVSHSIANLEEHLGVVLIDRDVTPVRLTLEGQAIVEDAQRVLAKAEALQLRARDYRAGVETRLTIGFDTIFPREALAASLAKAHAAYPSVAVRVVSLVPSDPIQLVESGEADLGIGLLPGAQTRTLHIERLGFVRLLTVAASSHPLAQLRTGFADSELLDYTQIHVTDATRILRRDTSSAPPSAWRVVDLDINRQLILAGIGWGLLPEHAITADLKKKRLVVLIPKSRKPNGASPTPIAAISRADRNPGPVLKMLINDLRLRHDRPSRKKLS